MTIFVDTCIFVALHNSDDEFHQRAKELIKQALKGKFGKLFTSDYIIDEAITTALVRTKNRNLAIDLGESIITSPRITKLNVQEETFQLAWKKFKNLKDKRLSFTDCTSLAILELNKISQIMSFDSDFDGLISRVS